MDDFTLVIADYGEKRDQEKNGLKGMVSELLLEVKKLRRELADVRTMLELADIRKRDEYIRRGVAFPFTPEASKARPGAFRPRSIL
jgi:hypothetical protein